MYCVGCCARKGCALLDVPSLSPQSTVSHVGPQHSCSCTGCRRKLQESTDEHGGRTIPFFLVPHRRREVTRAAKARVRSCACTARGYAQCVGAFGIGAPANISHWTIRILCLQSSLRAQSLLVGHQSCRKEDLIFASSALSSSAFPAHRSSRGNVLIGH